MGHYAILDDKNIVVQVITGKDESDKTHDWEEYYGNRFGKKCLRTSYNTYAGKHNDGRRKAFRKNYAGIGFTYDEERDAFIPPSPYESWVLDEETCQWEAPVPMPEGEKNWLWNEEKGEWEEGIEIEIE